MGKLVRYATDKDYRFSVNDAHGLYRNMPDDEYLKRKFHARLGRDLDLDNPVTFNEKLQWLKLYDRQPIYTTLVDKYEVKKYVADLIGEEYVIPTLGVWDRFEDIDFNALPDQFVLKCTHDSGGLAICRDKASFDIERAGERIRASLKRNYYYRFREWPYKHVKPRVIAEAYRTDTPDSTELTDYKFYCFHGRPDCVMVCLDRGTGDTKFYFFDREWQLKRYNKRGKAAPPGFTIPKPEGMDEMFRIAETLSSGIPSVRIDLYQSSGQILFGEYTFYPLSGFEPNRLPEADLYFGNQIDLSKVKKTDFRH